MSYRSYRGQHRAILTSTGSRGARNGALVATTVAVAAAGLFASTAQTANAATGHNWSGVAQCESGGNWHINTGNGFYGGLQFTKSTWLSYGGGAYGARADSASARAQITVAERVLAGQGIGAWPVCGRYLTGGSTPNAAPATTPCSGWNGHYFNGRREYNCSFDRTSPVWKKYNTQVGTLLAGTSWVICQAKGSTVRLDTSYYNYWWAYTVADNGSIGWVNAVYGSGGDNYGAFSGVPVCSASTKFTPPIVGRTAPPSSSNGDAILRAALSERGVPYVYGGGNQYGPTNGGFDCSGLVVYAVYQATHKVLYHQAAYQWQHSASEGATRVSKPGSTAEP